METVYLDAEDLEERMSRAAQILAEGVYAFLKEQGILENKEGEQQIEEKKPVDRS